MAPEHCPGDPVEPASQRTDIGVEGKEKQSCARSFVSKLGGICAAGVLIALPLESGFCQQAAEAEPSFTTVRDSMGPVTDLVAGLVFPFVWLWYFVIQNSSVAILISAASAAAFATISIRHQRHVTTLRETYATIKKDLWDKDFLNARKEFGRIKRECKRKNISIAAYCPLAPEEDAAPKADSRTKVDAKKAAKKAGEQSLTDSIASGIAGKEADDAVKNDRIRKLQALNNILNDYENMAIGIKMNILDEDYLYRWMKSSLIDDWQELNPLVTAFRHARKKPAIYIEFEGLASAWMENKSYKNGRKLNRTERKLSVM